MLTPEVHALKKRSNSKKNQCLSELKKWYKGECVSCPGGKVYYKGKCTSKRAAEKEWRENNTWYVPKCKSREVLYNKKCYKNKRAAEKQWSKDFPEKKCEAELGFWAGNECMKGEKARKKVEADKCRASKKVMYQGQCIEKVDAEKAWLNDNPKSQCLYKLQGDKGVKVNTRLWHNKKCWEEVKQVKKSKKSKSKRRKKRSSKRRRRR